ncbi:MAG: hypothetical protein IKJ37_00820 [Kiritimatiellae bacterium]|nr:hypothetical protein [Kiritimatiellia bacterium]
MTVAIYVEETAGKIAAGRPELPFRIDRAGWQKGVKIRHLFRPCLFSLIFG